MDTLTHDAAGAWIERWDRQQEGYVPAREERFTALIDALEAGAGRPDPLVVDLGCGPGSLAARIAARLPAATVVAVDADPMLLALGKAHYGHLPTLRFVDADLRVAGWSAALGLGRPADAAVSTTALHWLREPALRAMYAELATVLRPGGLLLNGDDFRVDDPVLAGLDHAVTRAESRRAGEEADTNTAGERRHGPVEDWQEWWRSAGADRALAPLRAERDRRRTDADHGGSESVALAAHIGALRAAGFDRIGTVWQHGESRVLCAVRPRADT